MDIGIEKLNTTTLNSILSEKISYYLPPFQRDYSWSKTEWIELLEDAEKCFDYNNQHFFGFMTFKNDGQNSISIIEGQQRLATITIIIALIRDLLFALNKDVANQLDSEFIKSKNPFSTSGIKFYRLKLASYNQTFFEKHIQICKSADVKLKSFKSEKKLNQSKKNIIGCYKYFHEYFSDKIKTLDKDSKINFLMSFSERLLNNFVVVSTRVKDEVVAYNIFQTLNNRGLDLNLYDLIKVYLFSCANDKLEEVQQKWDEIRLNIEQVNGNEFFRHYWLSKYDVVRGVDLLKVIEKRIKDQYHVLSFLSEIVSESENYNSLLFPSTQVWDDPNIIDELNNIHILSKQLTLPILLACKKVFKDEKAFLAAVKIIINFTFRYLTIGDREHKTFERVLSKVAQELRKGDIKHVDQIRPELIKHDTPDENFKLSFTEKDFKKAPLAKYVLEKIEEVYTGEVEKVSKTITLEHILPKKPNTAWKSYLKSEKMDFESNLHKIGNLTLLNKRPNGQIQNKFITEKSKMLSQCSKLKISESLYKRTTWNEKNIRERGRQFAEVAVKIWKI